MNYKSTILNISAGVFLIGVLIFTIFNYEVLSGSGGWGMLYMVGISSAGILALLIDFFLQLFIKNRLVINVIGFIVALVFAISIIYF